MPVHVTLRLDHRALRAALQENADACVRRAAHTTVTRARNNLAGAGRDRTGPLSMSIDAKRVNDHGTSVTYEVSTHRLYAAYQEFGIGPVVPVRAKVLRFKPKGSNSFVFAHRTKGFPGVHYMEKAARSLTIKDFLP